MSGDPIPTDDAERAVAATATACTDLRSPWFGEIVVRAHVGTGRIVGPFGGYVDLAEAFAILNRDGAVNEWDPDTGALLSSADLIDGFHWTFPDVRTPAPVPA